MKRSGPRFRQLERLTEYNLDDRTPGREWSPTKRRPGRRATWRRELDELIPEDGRVIGENGDAE